MSMTDAVTVCVPIFRRKKRLVLHPDERGLELVGNACGRIGLRDEVAARDVDFVGERQRHGLARHGLGQVAVVGDDARHRAFLAGRLHPDAIARLDRAAGDGPGEAAKIQVRPVHPLHRQPERRALHALLVDFDGFQVAHQGRAAIPRHLAARVRDVVSLEGGYRDEGDVLQPDLAREGAVIVDDALECLFAVVDQVHLVDGHHDVADAQKGNEVTVAARLGQHAFARIDHHNRRIGRRRAGHHVARVLLVPGGIGHDELAALGREEPVSDVNGDALFALRGEPVDQQCEVDVVALRAPLARVRFHGGNGVLEQHLRVVEQPADERALAVVHAAAGDEPQQALLLVGLEVATDVGGDEIADVCHQK
jgi:hypothetical protein